MQHFHALEFMQLNKKPRSIQKIYSEINVKSKKKTFNTEFKNVEDGSMCNMQRLATYRYKESSFTVQLTDATSIMATVSVC